MKGPTGRALVGGGTDGSIPVRVNSLRLDKSAVALRFFARRAPQELLRMNTSIESFSIDNAPKLPYMPGAPRWVVLLFAHDQGDFMSRAEQDVEISEIRGLIDFRDRAVNVALRKAVCLTIGLRAMEDLYEPEKAEARNVMSAERIDAEIKRRGWCS